MSLNNRKCTIKMRHLKLRKGAGKVDTVRIMNAFGKVEIKKCSFLTLALDRVNGELCVLSSLPLAKERPVSIEKEITWISEAVWMLLRRDKAIAPARKRTTIPRTSKS